MTLVYTRSDMLLGIKGQRSKSQGQSVSYLSNGKAFELKTRHRNGAQNSRITTERHSWPLRSRSRSRSQGHLVHVSISRERNASETPKLIGRIPAALAIMSHFQDQKVKGQQSAPYADPRLYNFLKINFLLNWTSWVDVISGRQWVRC